MIEQRSAFLAGGTVQLLAELVRDLLGAGGKASEHSVDKFVERLSIRKVASAGEISLHSRRRDLQGWPRIGQSTETQAR